MYQPDDFITCTQKQLTLKCLAVGGLHRIVEANADWGKAHLALETSTETIIESAWSFMAADGADGADETPILWWFDWGSSSILCGRRTGWSSGGTSAFPLDLQRYNQPSHMGPHVPIAEHHSIQRWDADRMMWGWWNEARIWMKWWMKWMGFVISYAYKWGTDAGITFWSYFPFPWKNSIRPSPLVKCTIKKKTRPSAPKSSSVIIFICSGSWCVHICMVRRQYLRKSRMLTSSSVVTNPQTIATCHHL